jgi:hypothetical protein
MMHMPKIIKSPSDANASQRSIMEGIVKTGMTSFQRNAIDGVIKSGMPEHKRKAVPVLHKAKESATKVDVGYVGFPGRGF